MSLRAAHLAVLKSLIPRQHQPAVDKLFRDLVFRDEISGYANQQGTLDHGTALAGLADDDHTQYLKEKASGGTAAEIPTHTHASAAQAGTVDHGALTGLTDDDHTQYLKEKASGGLAAEVPTHTHADAANAGTIAHTALTSIGTNTHTQIDSHIASTANPHVVKYEHVFTDYTDKVARFSEQDQHGGIVALATGQPLDATPTDLPVNAGIGKLLIVVNAGSDLAGSITVTGTSVNRDTGAETLADTDTVVVDAITTDDSTTDAQSNVIHGFTGAYITSKWFKGAVVLSTADLTLTDVDVYGVAFNQCNDKTALKLKTVDMFALATNASAWVYYYLYSLIKTTGSKCDITPEVSVSLDTVGVADRYYRLRRGGIDVSLNGSTDGFWMDVFYGPTASTFWEDSTICIYVEVTP